MPAIIPAGYMLASFGGLVDGDSEEMFFTLGFATSGTIDTDTAAGLYTAWATSMSAVYSTEWTFESCRIKVGPSATGPTYEHISGAATGAEEATCLPPNTAVLVQKQTGMGGRANRGRCYLAGTALVGQSNSAGFLDLGPRQDRYDAWMDFIAAALAIDEVSFPALFHSESSTPTAITGYNVPRQLATQRRRLRP